VKAGIGLSRTRELEKAFQEAYRQALQKLGALKPDFAFVGFTYDHVLEPEIFTGIISRNLRDLPHMGCSTWSAWGQKEFVEGEGGLIVLCLKDVKTDDRIFKVHSLREKQDLWASEVVRYLETLELSETESHSLFMVADAIHFQNSQGFDKIKNRFPNLSVFGFGASYGIPQCSLLHNAQIYSNCLIGFLIENQDPVKALIQNIRPEAGAIRINRMSENLVIEIDEKPAFYRLCEHLMSEDDMPMMAPDEFRKHMGNMYIVEKPMMPRRSSKLIGESHRVISLLGSEMTTGMVAVGESLDFGQQHFLGQKKIKYIEVDGLTTLEELKSQVPSPRLLMMFSSTAHFRDKERSISDVELVRKVFPDVPLFGMGSHGEYMDALNHQATLLVAF